MKQKPKGMRRVAILLSTITVVALGLTAAFAYRKHRNRVQTDGWRNDGIAADKAADYPKAIEKLELSLSRRPDDREALAAYIDARPRVESPKLSHLADTARAIRYLLQQDPTLGEYREKLMSLYQQMHLRTEVLDTATTLLQSDPHNKPALQARAITLTELKRYDEAAAATAKWIEADPLNLDGQILQLSLMRQIGRSAAQINEVVQAWGNQYPDQAARFQLLNGVAFGQSGDRTNALLWLRKASQQTPPDAAFSQILISQLAELGDQGEDVAVLQKLTDHGAQGDVQESLLCRRWELGQWKEVVELSTKMDLTKAATPANVIALASMAHKNLSDDASSTRLIDILARRTDATSTAWANILRARTTDISAWQAVAQQCRTALATDAGNSYLRYFLGEALAATGETELALESFQLTAEINRTWGLPPARLADLLMQQGNLQASAQAAVASLHRTPNASAALTVARVVATLDQKGLIDPQTLPKLIDELDRVVPGNEDVSLMRVQSLVRAEASDKAVEKIRGLLAASPALSESALLKLAQLSNTAHLGEEAEILNVSAKAHGITPQQTLAAAMLDASAGNAIGGLKRIDAASNNAAPNTKRDWAFARAKFLDETKDGVAPTQWKSISADYPGDVAVQQAALASHAMRGDRAFLEQAVQRLRAVLGEQSLVCTLARVRILVENRSSDADDREIAETLRQVIAAHPAMAEPRVLWATSLEHAGKIDDAIDQLENAQRINSGSTGLPLKLAALYGSKGDLKKSREQLEHIKASNTLGEEETFFAAQLFMQFDDFGSAIALLEKPGLESDNHATLLLAELYWRNNQLDKVDAMIPRIESVASAQNIEFVARFRAAQGKAAEAEQALARLDSLQAPAVTKSLARGNYLSATGHADEATKQYQQATLDAPKDIATWQTLVAHLMNIGRVADAAAAAKTASAALPAGNAFAELAQCIQNWATAFSLPEMKPLAMKFIASPSNSPATRDILSSIAGAQTSNDPLAMLNAARTLSQRYPGVESVVLWSAAVDLQFGRSNEAGVLLNSAMTMFKSSPDIAAMTTRFFLARRQWKDASQAAGEWRKRSVQFLQPDVAQARALVSLNRADEAVQLLQTYAPAATRPSNGGADLLLTYAEALQASGKAQQAEDLLLGHAADGIDWRAVCLQFATTKLTGDDARKWITKVTTSIDMTSSTETLLVARGWAAFIARNPGNDADRREATRLFDVVASRPDVSAAALEQAGMFAEQSGIAAGAIVLYQRCVQLDARRPIAQNNLAMLIASTGGNLPDALTHANLAVAANRAEPAFLDTAATIKTKVGDNAGAVDSLRKAVDLDPDNPKWRVALAEVFLTDNRKAEASDALSAADSMGMDTAAITPQLRKRIDELREKIARSQSANVSAAIPLTVPH